MTDTFIVRVPDRSGVFLDIAQLIAAKGGSLLRINYNKSVDENTVFLDVEASPESLETIRSQLSARGFLKDRSTEYRKVKLYDLTLPDGVGRLLPILELIHQRDLNISFVNYRKSQGERQHIRLGILLTRHELKDQLLEELSPLCEKVELVDYEVTDRSLDGSVFYATFAREIRLILGLSPEDTSRILVASNKIMQMLDEGNEQHLKTFDYIRRFARFIADHRGERFDPRVTTMSLTPELALTSIEPPCGCTMYILTYEDQMLCVDTGFSCYRQEMGEVLERLFPGFSTRRKVLLLTHSDIDHSGLCDFFDQVCMVQGCLDNFIAEVKELPNYREENPGHAPYSHLSKIITSYHTPDLGTCHVLGVKTDKKLLSRVGVYHFGPWDFMLYEGLGGHVKGETIIACPELSLVFSGDIFINVHGLIPEQADFNRLAPYLMTGVDEDSALARQTRSYFQEKYAGYTVCPGHGAILCLAKREES